MVAHNAGFDIAFLNAELKRAAKPPITPELVVDTSRRFRILRPVPFLSVLTTDQAPDREPPKHASGEAARWTKCRTAHGEISPGRGCAQTALGFLGLLVQKIQRPGQVRLSGGSRRCSRLRTGLTASACPSTCSALRKNRIDLSVLRDLTDQDPKDLGIVLGDRRRILRLHLGHRLYRVPRMRPHHFPACG